MIDSRAPVRLGQLPTPLRTIQYIRTIPKVDRKREREVCRNLYSLCGSLVVKLSKTVFLKHYVISSNNRVIKSNDRSFVVTSFSLSNPQKAIIVHMRGSMNVQFSRSTIFVPLLKLMLQRMREVKTLSEAYYRLLVARCWRRCHSRVSV